MLDIGSGLVETRAKGTHTYIYYNTIQSWFTKVIYLYLLCVCLYMCVCSCFLFLQLLLLLLFFWFSYLGFFFVVDYPPSLFYWYFFCFLFFYSTSSSSTLSVIFFFVVVVGPSASYTPHRHSPLSSLSRVALLRILLGRGTSLFHFHPITYTTTTYRYSLVPSERPYSHFSFSFLFLSDHLYAAYPMYIFVSRIFMYTLTSIQYFPFLLPAVLFHRSLFASYLAIYISW